jgi:hypothetical protein
LKNACFNVAVTITAGAVVAFFACLGYFTRAAFLNGFADGFNAARERFRKILDAANARDVYEKFRDEIDKDGTP